jgi:hypothetical protein
VDLKPTAVFQVWLASALLGAYGVYLAVVNWKANFPVWGAVFAAPWLFAAVVVLLRMFWARFLVFALSALFVLMWFYYLVRNAHAGAFIGWSRSLIIVSMLPAVVAGLALAFCCYVAARYMRRSTGRT